MSILADLKTLAEKYTNKELKSIEEVLDWAHEFRKNDAYAFDDGEIGIDYDLVGRFLKNLSPEHEKYLNELNSKTSKEPAAKTADDLPEESDASKKAKEIMSEWTEEG